MKHLGVLLLLGEMKVYKHGEETVNMVLDACLFPLWFEFLIDFITYRHL